MENQPIFQNPFSFINIDLTQPQKTMQELQKIAEIELQSLEVNPFEQYLEEYDKVFSGELDNELKKCQSQLYALGQIMREGQPITTFSMDM